MYITVLLPVDHCVITCTSLCCYMYIILLLPVHLLGICHYRVAPALLMNDVFFSVTCTSVCCYPYIIVLLSVHHCFVTYISLLCYLCVSVCVCVQPIGKWPALYRIQGEQKSKQSFLDPNHTHFILVDNGTQHRFATEIEFRAKLEKEISQLTTSTGHGE